MVTKKNKWVLPEPPHCLICNKEVRPEAVLDNGEAHLCWSEWCEYCNLVVNVEDSRFDIDWPFEEERCSPDDLKSLGFSIVVA